MNERYGHIEFEELCALAGAGELAEGERIKFVRHLALCAECAEAYAQYKLLTTDGIPQLAFAHAQLEEAENCDRRLVRKKLFARIRDAEKEQSGNLGLQLPATRVLSGVVQFFARSCMPAAAAACVVVGIAYGAYRLGARPANHQTSTASSQSGTEENSLKALVAEQTERIAFLEQENSIRQSEVERLRAAQMKLQSRSHELLSSNDESQAELQQIENQRDSVAAQLASIQQQYADAQKELSSIKNQRDKMLLDVASLDGKVQDLEATNREKEQRIKDDEQYLTADRDIRELMGARKLYIADVFDVDSGSQTRKPFGRIFYTENKSLIFYAFDLDRESRVKNATFQVWGEKDAAQGEKAHPLNLGILYMDSESNRRWVLRSDDSKRLAEIDAVFVTVEPNGGSLKPTSKPFLYALLRKEANHL